MASTSKPPPSKNMTRNTAAVAPAVITQLLKCGEHLKIFGKEIQIVNLVARVRHLQRSEFKNTFIIQDMTGTMTAVQFHSGDEKDYEHIICNSYVHIYGGVMRVDKRNVLNVFRVLPLKDVNQIVFHYLQCVNNKLKFEKLQYEDDLTQFSSSSSTENATNETMNPHYRKILNLVKNLDVELGLSRDVIEMAVENEISKSDIDEILDWLCAEGYLYTTIDDQHYKATDSWTLDNKI